MCSCLGSGYGCGGLDREVRDMEKGVAEAGELVTGRGDRLGRVCEAD